MPANVETMAYRFADRRDTPWNGISHQVQFNEQVGTEQFLDEIGAAWTVRKEPLWMRAHKDNQAWMHREHKKTKAFALIRDDTCEVFTIVTAQYKEIQNKQIFEFFRDWGNAVEAKIEAAGVLGNIVWALANVNMGFTLPNGDRVGGYMLFYNPHGRLAGGIKYIGLRLSCANMLSMLSRAHGLRIHHRTKFDPELAKRTMGISREQLSKFAKDCEFLNSRPCNQLQFYDYLRRLWPIEQNKEGKVVVPRMHEKAQQGYEAEQQAMLGHNWWRAYNAVTYAIDHNDSRSNKRALLTSNWFGAGEKTKMKALETALEMAR